ncbi:MAG: MraY family glycosyltransferase [Pseudomonadota bacterium]
MMGYTSFFAAFAVTLLAIYFIKPVALRIGLADCPGGRKCHEGVVPLVGGVAMFMGFVFSLVALPEPIEEFRSFVLAIAMLVIVGVLDDLHGLSARARFVAQIFAALIMVFWGGNVLTSLGSLLSSDPLVLGIFAIPFTVFGVVGVINALNMSDGVDGLAGSLVVISLISMSVLALSAKSLPDAHVMLLLVITIMAFLCLNFPIPGRKSAKIFMGDAGSMFLGFALAWFAIELSQGESAVMSPVAALWIVGLPIMDTVAVMFRRIIRRRSPFTPDRSHLHHVLLLAGYGSRGTVLIMIVIQTLCCLAGASIGYFGIPEYLMFYAYLFVFALYYWAMIRAWKVMKIIKLKKRIRY